MKDKLALKAERRLVIRKRIIVVAYGLYAVPSLFFGIGGMWGLLDGLVGTDAGVVAGAFGLAFLFAALVLLAVAFALKYDKFFDFIIGVIDFIKNRKPKELKLSHISRYKLLKLTEIFFSAKTQKEVFLQAMADWDEEVYKALEKNKDVSLFMINARNTYAFLAAMWQKSPVGDLIEFVIKIAKQ